MREACVVIPAGGVGARMGARVPKQFLSLGGVPILAATTAVFRRHPRVAAIVVAVPAAHVERTRRLLRVPTEGRRPTLDVVAGGDRRQDSVARALAAAPELPLTLVHDAVRPFVTATLVDRVLDAALDGGAAVCALPLAETLKRVQDGVVVETVDRAGLWAVQTPQAFRTSLLREAHDKARRDGFVGTDEAMLIERLGHPVRVVAGLVENVKITTPADLRRARKRTR